MIRKLPGENLIKSDFIFFELSPFAELVKICNQDISKSIAAESFKLGELIDDAV